MRITSQLFVQSIIRVHATSGGYSAILEKGAQEAGAVFIAHLTAKNIYDFYGPSPQSLIPDANNTERYFECLLTSIDYEELAKAIHSQKRFDPDIWVVELEGGKLPEALKIISDD